MAESKVMQDFQTCRNPTNPPIAGSSFKDTVGMYIAGKFYTFREIEAHVMAAQAEKLSQMAESRVMTPAEFIENHRRKVAVNLEIPLDEDGDLINLGGPIMCEFLAAYNAHVMAAQAMPKENSCLVCGRNDADKAIIHQPTGVFVCVPCRDWCAARPCSELGLCETVWNWHSKPHIKADGCRNWRPELAAQATKEQEK